MLYIRFGKVPYFSGFLVVSLKFFLCLQKIPVYSDKCCCIVCQCFMNIFCNVVYVGVTKCSGGKDFKGKLFKRIK